jgi:hypothetical protein
VGNRPDFDFALFSKLFSPLKKCLKLRVSQNESHLGVVCVCVGGEGVCVCVCVCVGGGGGGGGGGCGSDVSAVFTGKTLV